MPTALLRTTRIEVDCHYLSLTSEFLSFQLAKEHSSFFVRFALLVEPSNLSRSPLENQFSRFQLDKGCNQSSLWQEMLRVAKRHHNRHRDGECCRQAHWPRCWLGVRAHVVANASILAKASIVRTSRSHHTLPSPTKALYNRSLSSRVTDSHSVDPSSSELFQRAYEVTNL